MQVVVYCLHLFMTNKIIFRIFDIIFTIKYPHISQTMKIYILGAGSLGSAFGGILSLANEDVTLLCHSQAQAAIINTHGLDMRIGEETKNTAIKAAKAGDTLPVADLVIVLVKSQHTATAIQSITNIIDNNTVVMSLQNGMGHEDTIAEFVPKAQIIGGKTYVGGQRFSANHVLAGYKNKITIIGEFDGTDSKRVNQIAEIFNHAGLQTQISTNILGTMWDKLFINVATGAVSGISGLCYGELYKSKELEAVAIGAVSEAMEIAKAKNIDYSVPDGLTAWQMAGAGLPYEFKASMLQSLEAGNRTEIDFINGYVVKKGLEMTIPTPINQTLVACMKGIEQKMS
jgi:2-dehydropantoate 2-reductase